MLSLLAAVLLAQAPADSSRPVVVLATSKRPAVDQFVATLTTRAHALLKREGVAPLDEAVGLEQLKLSGISDPRTCQGGRSCVSRMAVILGAKAVVVGIDIGKAGAELAIVMEAVAADRTEPLLTSEFSVPIATFSDSSALPVTLFARQLKAKLDAEKPVKVVEAPKPVDVPRAVVLEPPPVTPPNVVVEPDPPKGKTQRIIGWSSAGGAVIAAGVGVALVVVGSGAMGRINDSVVAGSSPPMSRLPEGQLKALEGQANGAFTGALVSGVAAGLLGALATYCLVSDP